MYITFKYIFYISSLVSQAESHLNLNSGCKDTGQYSPATNVSALWITTEDTARAKTMVSGFTLLVLSKCQDKINTTDNTVYQTIFIAWNGPA